MRSKEGFLRTMPLPNKQKKEDKSKFMERCVANPKMKEEFPDIKRRIAVCISKYNEKTDAKEAKDGKYKGKLPKRKKKS